MVDDWQSMSSKARKAFTLQLVQVYGQTCCLCGLPIREDQLTCQHVKPRSKGGATNLENCRPAHAKCNYAAGNREPTGAAGVIHDGLDWFEVNAR